MLAGPIWLTKFAVPLYLSALYSSRYFFLDQGAYWIFSRYTYVEFAGHVGWKPALRAFEVLCELVKACCDGNPSKRPSAEAVFQDLELLGTVAPSPQPSDHDSTDGGRGSVRFATQNSVSYTLRSTVTVSDTIHTVFGFRTVFDAA